MKSLFTLLCVALIPPSVPDPYISRPTTVVIDHVDKIEINHFGTNSQFDQLIFWKRYQKKCIVDEDYINKNPYYRHHWGLYEYHVMKWTRINEETHRVPYTPEELWELQMHWRRHNPWGELPNFGKKWTGQGPMIPKYDPVANHYYLEWHDEEDNIHRKIISKIYEETWTANYDPEQEDLRIWPKSDRVGLTLLYENDTSP